METHETNAKADGDREQTRLALAGPGIDWNAMRWTALSLLGHAAFLFLVYFVPPSPRSLSIDAMDQSDRFGQYLVAPPEVEQARPAAWIAPRETSESEGGTGRRHVGDEGEMGDPREPTKGRRFGIEGPRSNPDPRMGRTIDQTCPEHSGILAVLRAPTSPWGSDRPLGNDAENALGALLGREIGASFGYGGLGMRGTGRGGGGDGRGTIGLGELGRIGHGAGGGRGMGYGRGDDELSGEIGEHTPEREPEGEAAVAGTLSREVIRRYIRRHRNEIRHCYELGLRRRPDLAGRVRVRFVITGSGSVAGASVADSTLGNGEVEACVARAVQRISFPAPEDGGVVSVTYPFLFQPAD